VDFARVDSRKTMTTLRRFVSRVPTNSVSVGSEPAASFTSTSGVAISLTIMFATTSLEKALPAPVALGTNERENRQRAARYVTSRPARGRPRFRPGGTCQRWAARRVTTAGPTVP
jgi:hypothetical protein